MRRSVRENEKREDGLSIGKKKESRTARSGLVGLCLSGALVVATAFAAAPAVQWVRHFSGEGTAFGYWVRQTSDSGFIAAGMTKAPHDYPEAYIIKTDSLGSEMWSGTFGTGSVFYEIEQTRDGGYVACGDSWQHVYLTKLTGDGSVEWCRT